MLYPSTLQEMITLATAGIQFKTWPYTLDLLPVEGMDDGTQSIGDVQRRLRDTLSIINGIRKGPYGLPAVLAQKIDNIRFHVVNALYLIDGATARLGHNLREPYLSTVEGLQSAIDNHVVAIDRARGAWTEWLTQALAHKGPEDVLPPPPRPKPSLLGYGGLGVDLSADTQTAPTDPTGGLVKSMQLSDYLAVGIVTGALLLLYKFGGK